MNILQPHHRCAPLGQSHPEIAAFSLVEVVFALAIASLGFLTLLGLLPSGLEMARNSADLAAEARISQHLSGELQSTPWEELDWNGFGQSRYFNDQGVEIAKAEVEADGGMKSMLSYVATVELTTQANDIVLPVKAGTGGRRGGGTTATRYEPCLRRAKIHIVTTSDVGYQFKTTGTAGRSMRSYTVMVAESNG